MNINIKKKFLYFKEYKIKCSIGKRGITSRKLEGDQKTPKGVFNIKSMLYRKDRIPKVKSQIKKIIIKKNMGWCDDSSSRYYNRLVKLPFNLSAEKLWLKARVYDVIIIINYNLKPTIKNKGSAIFLHIAKRNYRPTKGCIAITKKDIILLISKMNNKTKIKIS